ncbi:sensor histidine kinase [Nitriliruptor alkaliphilus]|uniref:sensor histidine kinase n=1 Tax=Nitriliruptor alkaliphilus TaxID=427918 RepID=UPI000695A99D|nr:HAMP domain-containing sensor histidine kinase [Nitriliruptor alkaliphilus]
MSDGQPQEVVRAQDGVPEVDDILEALARASVGRDVRIEADPTRREEPLALIGAALNILLEDLAFRQREREEALRQVAVAEAKQEFLAYLSHDMQTPLSMLLGAVDLLGPDARTTDLAATLPLMRSAVGTLQRLVQQFLDLARLDAQRPLEVATRTVDLLGVIDAAAELFADRGPIEVHTPEHVPPVDADPGRVEQILANLLGNAYKYARDPSIDVEHDVEAGCVQISIVDHGEGLSETDLEHVFGRFARGGVSSRAAGTGLGLFISRALAEAMGGSLHADSRPGEGSRFTLSLPVAATP